MGLAQEAAEQMGITGNDWFEKLQQQAKGNTKVTTEFVRRFSANAEKMFGSPEALKKALQQPDALAKSISNIGYNFMVDFSKAGGSYMIIQILTGISKALTSIDYGKLSKTLGDIAHFIGDVAKHIPTIVNILKEILIAVALIAGFRLLGRGIVYLARVGRFMRIFSKMLGKTNPLVLSALIKNGLSEGIAKFFAGVGLKTLAKYGVRFIPVVGQILTAILIISDVVRWIARKIGYKDNVSMSEQLRRATGMDATTINAIKSGINLNNIHSQRDLENALRMSSDPNAYNLIPYAKYDDKSVFNLVINNTELSAEDIANVSMGKYGQENEKKKNWFDRFSKPNIPFGNPQ